MENNSSTLQSDTGKVRPQQVAGNNEEQAKEKTAPLKQEDANPTDRDEGDMNNGEVGAGLQDKS